MDPSITAKALDINPSDLSPLVLDQESHSPHGLKSGITKEHTPAPEDAKDAKNAAFTSNSFTPHIANASHAPLISAPLIDGDDAKVSDLADDILGDVSQITHSSSKSKSASGVYFIHNDQGGLTIKPYDQPEKSEDAIRGGAILKKAGLATANEKAIPKDTKLAIDHVFNKVGVTSKNDNIKEMLSSSTALTKQMEAVKLSIDEVAKVLTENSNAEDPLDIQTALIAAAGSQDNSIGYHHITLFSDIAKTIQEGQSSTKVTKAPQIQDAPCSMQDMIDGTSIEDADTQTIIEALNAPLNRKDLGAAFLLDRMMNNGDRFFINNESLANSGNIMIASDNTLVFIDNDSKKITESVIKDSYAFAINPQVIRESLAETFDTVLQELDGGVEALVKDMIQGMKDCVHNDSFLSALQSSDDDSDQQLAKLIKHQRSLQEFAK